MKKSITMSLVSMMMASSVLFSCSTPSEKMEQAEENVVDSKKELKEEKAAYKEYRKNAEMRISENEKNIAEFNQRIKNQKADAKKDYEQKIADLNQKNSDMKMRLADFKSDNQSNWETFKTDFNREMDELGNSISNFNVKDDKKN
jgi:ABC-type transporter MlaC component